MEQTRHKIRSFARSDDARKRRAVLFEDIRAFLVTNSLEITPSNLVAAHAVASGSESEFLACVNHRQTQGQPITSHWIESTRRELRNSNHASKTNDTSDKINRLVDGLEATMAGFALTTENARQQTKKSREEVARHSSLIHSTQASGQDSMLEVSQAMLRTLQKIQIDIEESQADTAKLRDNLEQARREADTDPLTELPNRRAFERTFKQMERDAKAKGSKLFIAMCDVDHFKRVNDTFGHQTGDNLLRAIAATLREHVSPIGNVARYGGEEFVLLVDGVDQDSVIERIDAARSALAARKFVARRQGKPIGQVSFSAGVADVTSASDRAEAIASADAMLYRAKDEGRNRIVAAWDVD